LKLYSKKGEERDNKRERNPRGEIITTNRAREGEMRNI
jgi:hypothetical protein